MVIDFKNLQYTTVTGKTIRTKISENSKMKVQN